MATSTLKPHGQVTIPTEIRHRLGLTAGIRLRIEVDADDKIVLIPEESTRAKPSVSRWSDFVAKTYGSMADDPIARGDQGSYEKREELA